MESLRLAVASILAVFIIDKPVDAMGNVVEPSGEYTSTGLVRYMCILCIWFADSTQFTDYALLQLAETLQDQIQTSFSRSCRINSGLCFY